MNHRVRLLAVGLLTCSLVAGASTASADAAPVVTVVASGLDGPLQIDVGASGQVYVGQAFSGTLTKIRPNGTTSDLVTSSGREIAGVASRGNDVAFTWTRTDPAHPAAELRLRKANGTVTTIADLYAYEKRKNPDSINTYGFKTLSASCAAKVPAAFNNGKPYTGVVDSHPYALANAPDGGWYVADAGANDVLYVSPGGSVETSNIMHRIKVTITTGMARALGLPSCTVGKPYNLEPVPTDIELAEGGEVIYVSLFPGGPEDLSLGDQGMVVHAYPCVGCEEAGYELDGDQSQVANRLAGASNVAVGPGGRLYVSELYGDDILVRTPDGWLVLALLPAPASIEVVGKTMYVAYDAFGNGKVATISLQGT